MTQPLRIAIVGTGGVGGYFGARLAQAGHQVHFLARGDHLHALQTSGLTVHSIRGDITLPAVAATDNPATIGPVDLILVTVKAWQVAAAATTLAPMIGYNTMIIPLQNGVEAIDLLASVIDRSHLLGGLCWIVSFIEAPGVIRHTGVEPRIVFGELNAPTSPRAEHLQHMFLHAGITQVDLVTDIQAAIWEKFLFIASVSGVGAVTQMPIGITRQIPQTRQMIVQAIEEIINLAHKRQIRLPTDIFERTMAFIDGMPPHNTFSMQRDIAQGRPSELEAQNGAVVRLGHATGLEVPLHTVLYASLLPREQQARGQLTPPAH
ncbi:MAG: 2-dehydropantoate 2-reductase [Chloroflexaceae bacterium]|nr:2-dehydropantoate 2-reductase [Chloroflexaceae bacterium]